MDSGFEERRKKNEEKWALDETLRFKALARRNKLLGRWAAAELGLPPAEVDAYVREVVVAEVRPDGALAKVIADLAAKGGPDEAAVRRKMEELFLLAQAEIRGHNT